jgi:hypothetical protein
VEDQLTLSVGTFFIVIFGLMNMVITLVLVYIMKDLRDLSRQHQELKDRVHMEYATKTELLRLENSISNEIHEIKAMISTATKEFRESVDRIYTRMEKRTQSRSNGDAV